MEGRTEKALIAKVEGALSRGAEDFFQDNGFQRISTLPHIVDITGACENIDTLFQLDYFGRRTFLAQTGQLYLELLIPDLERVCCEIKSFRAEPDADSRHLTEFPLVEFEYAYQGDGFSRLLDDIEYTVKSMMSRASMQGPTLKALGVEEVLLAKTISEPFERIFYTEAIDLLKDKGYDMVFGSDLKHDHEMAIVEYTGRPTFVMKFPESIKFFNMRRDRKNPELVESADLILPYSGESVGSAVREEDPDLLIEKLKASDLYRLHLERGGKYEDFSWYLDAVREKPVPHAGCGIGLSRVAQSVLQRPDIRKSAAYAMNCESYS